MAVLLTVDRTDGARVSLWGGQVGDRHPFEDETVEHFREWLAEASFGQGPDVDVWNVEEDRIITLLFEAPRSRKKSSPSLTGCRLTWKACWSVSNTGSSL